MSQNARDEPNSPESLVVKGVSHSFDSNPVLKDVSLTVAAGEIVCLLGASGSGKSTLLRVIAGLVPLQAGSIGIPGLPLAI
ncbi:MAG: ATP-binding cassette domain-containing protein, partial [Gammaproteobacteria bacterium]|nr:ATP-binding cassette domain-containing protein [Gammaproteobacteria bacterium]